MFDKIQYMRLATLPILGNVIRNIDSDIGKIGIQKTMAKIIKNNGTKLLIINKNKELKNILKTRPVVVVANHPYEAEVLVLLASLENRKDINLIISSSFSNVTPNIDKHLIPVHIYNRQVCKKGPNIKFRLIRKIHKTKALTCEDEHKKNIDSINLASKKINKGELVVLFPSGGGVDGKWFNGIGHLINGVKNKNNAYIVKAHIQGTSNKDYLRIIPGIAKLLPKFRVNFDEAIPMKIFKDFEPKAITLSLETGYNNWIKTIEHEKRFKFQPWIRPIKGAYLLRTLLFWFIARLG